LLLTQQTNLSESRICLAVEQSSTSIYKSERKRGFLELPDWRANSAQIHKLMAVSQNSSTAIYQTSVGKFCTECRITLLVCYSAGFRRLLFQQGACMRKTPPLCGSCSGTTSLRIQAA